MRNENLKPGETVHAWDDNSEIYCSPKFTGVFEGYSGMECMPYTVAIKDGGGTKPFHFKYCELTPQNET
jgi:hypothetical protein